MVQNTLVSELMFDADLEPSKRLGSEIRGKLWQNILSISFRKSLGNPEIRHITMGSGGESHVMYDVRGMWVSVYDDGELRVFDDKFTIARSTEVEHILKAVFQLVTRTANKRVNYDVDLRLHMLATEPSLKKFLKESVQFSGKSTFLKAIGRYKGLRSFLIRMSDNFGISLTFPDHIDFLYHDTISSGSNRKGFVSSFATKSMKFLKSMSRYAR